ncbi:hypothetical protein SAMN05421774_104323 [Gemmobacter megaterium]|uniref:Uncharacterized protein n=1 Tax=Gemmobacter megaterium TaxID=1086013 RepID=A0A1N7P1D6_9RHOB|nr:hypothetical protein [Gemmobacter megaterium]GGE15158.1 hypothetical protein GCM10011345_21300 [Gemmobacter megaterium]SIT04380.1 hypothetical protein SAMN05421774_104323 [Gemmobacter megaterium]
MNKFQIAVVAATLSFSGIPAMAQDATEVPAAGDEMRATLCSQQLGYANAVTDKIVVVPMGAADVGIARLETATAGPVQIRAFDMASCQPVAVKVWVQDQMGTVTDEQASDMASFSAARFVEGVNYIRAERALDRDLGFVISGVE